jgi:photosystem II stability/assembly factor-like uncharacterized protein
MIPGDDVEATVRKHMAALRAALSPPRTLEREILQAVRTSEGRSTQPITRQLALASGVFVFLMAVVVGFTLLKTIHARVPISPPAPKPSGILPTATPTAEATPTQWPAAQVAFVSADVGVVSHDGLIERTEDGGRSWRTVRSAVFVRQLQHLDNGTFFAVTTTGLLVSHDAGATWGSINPRGDINAVDFISSIDGYAVSAGRLLRTSDGGATFTPLTTGTTAAAMAFIDSRRGWIAGGDGIAATTDGGQTWTRQAALPFAHAIGGDSGVDLNGIPSWTVSFADSLHGFVLFALPSTTMSQRPAYVFSTADGGAHWDLRSYEHFFPVPSPLPSTAGDFPADVVGTPAVTSSGLIEVLDSDLGGAQGIFLATSSDGGRSWTESRLPVPPHAIAVGGQIEVMGQRQWVIWTDGTQAHVLSSSDGGRTWVESRP